MISVVLQGLKPASWPDALAAVKKGLEGTKRNEIKAIAGKLADAESMVALKVCFQFIMQLSCNLYLGVRKLAPDSFRLGINSS